MRLGVKALAVVALIILIPAGARAQAVIAGSVRDTSGAVLPGVTVEASSPALIEKVRTSISDSSGQYRIEDLRPGVYKVTFTLPGFSTFEREGVELTGSFTATINAELRVGNLQETVTVTGESPIVDVSSARRQTVINNEVLKAIPTVRSYNALVVVVPGVVTNTNDVATGTATTQFPIHGGRNNEGRMTIDGLNVGNPPGGNQPPGFSVDVGNSEEISFTTSGGLGESETAGLVMNVVPKTGGNSIHGSAFYSGSGKNLQSDNTEGTGVAAPTPLTKIYDLNGAIGGPIMRDKLWYFATARTQGSTRVNANQFVNLNAGDATKWLYAPDLNDPGFSDRTWENISGRLTWQMTPRNKIGGYWDEQWVCRKCEGNTIGITTPAVVSPEANGPNQTLPLRVPQVTWSSPVTNRLLLDAGFGGTYYGWGNFERDPNPTHDLIKVTEQCATGCAANGNRPGIVYRSQDYGDNRTGSYTWRGSLAYVTGRHSFKVGYQGTLMTDDRTWTTNTTDLWYRFNNGVPNQLTQTISPWINNARAGWDAVFAQEQFTMGRLTLQGAVRFDVAKSWFPEQNIGPDRFLATPYHFDETKGVNSYKDITPRFGAAYDVFGNGKTAVKMNLGQVSGRRRRAADVRQLESDTSHPDVNRVLSACRVSPGRGSTRTGISRPTATCPIRTPTEILRRSTVEAGQTSAARFRIRRLANLCCQGTTIPTSSADGACAPATGAWASRSSSRSFSACRSRSVTTGGRSTASRVNDNLALTNADLTPYTVLAPSDSRLPNGGGYPIGTLYDVVPGKAGQVDTLSTLADNYGKQYQYFNGLDVTVSLRQGGLTLQGGTSTGQNVADACEVRDQPPRGEHGDRRGSRRLDRQHDEPLLPRRIRHAHAASRSRLVRHPEDRRAGQRGVPEQAWRSCSRPTTRCRRPRSHTFLGRLPSGNVPNVTINLIEPGSLYGDRINQLDFRIAKNFTFGSTRSMISADLYNVLNANPVISYNNSFTPNGPWLQPNSILTGRLVRISVDFNF